MSRFLEKAVKETIDELYERGIDASMLRYEISEIIDEYYDYDIDEHIEEVAQRLGLM